MLRHILDELIECYPELLTDSGFQVIEKSGALTDDDHSSYVRLENDPIVVTIGSARGIYGEIASNLEPENRYQFFQITGLLGKDHRRLRGDAPYSHSASDSEDLAYTINFLLANLTEIRTRFQPEHYRSTKALLEEVKKRLFAEWGV